MTGRRGAAPADLNAPSHPIRGPRLARLSTPGAICALTGAVFLGIAQYLAQRKGLAGPVVFSIALPSCALWVTGCLLLYKEARRNLGRLPPRVWVHCALCGRRKSIWRRACEDCGSDRIHTRVLGRTLVASIALGFSVAAVEWFRVFSVMLSIAADTLALTEWPIGLLALLVLNPGLPLCLAALGVAIVAWRGTGPRFLRVWWLPFELIAQDDNLAVIAGSGFALFVADYVF